MKSNPKNNFKLSLLNQIEHYKNFSEHKQRLNESRYRSPINPTKKSMSYDQQKLSLHHYIKSRKQYTSDFKRRQLSKLHEDHDAKMLQKILQYDQKLFTFSLPSARPMDSKLHHNSMVSSNQKSWRIDQQNEKIHFRITNAKSLYSQQTSNKSSLSASKSAIYSMRGNCSLEKIGNLNSKLFQKRIMTEPEVSHEEEGLVKTQTGVNIRLPYSKLHDLNPELNTNLSNTLNFKRSSLVHNSNLLASSNMQMKSRLCERIRREKLAIKLYEKKQKLQTRIPSKLKILTS